MAPKPVGRHSRPGRNKSLVPLATLLGLTLGTVMVLGMSRAAFSAQTQNTQNSVTVGDVSLTDDDNGFAMFQVTDMAPGTSVVECVSVTYDGSIADPGAVKLYSGGFTDSGTLASELDVQVDVGTGGVSGDCGGFTSSGAIFTSAPLTTFDSTHSSYLTGIIGWDPSSTPESRTFRITVSLPTDADAGVQGDSITSWTFTWQVQS